MSCEEKDNFMNNGEVDTPNLANMVRKDIMTLWVLSFLGKIMIREVTILGVDEEMTRVEDTCNASRIIHVEGIGNEALNASVDGGVGAIEIIVMGGGCTAKI